MKKRLLLLLFPILTVFAEALPCSAVERIFSIDSVGYKYFSCFYNGFRIVYNSENPDIINYTMDIGLWKNGLYLPNIFAVLTVLLLILCIFYIIFRTKALKILVIVFSILISVLMIIQLFLELDLDFVFYGHYGLIVMAVCISMPLFMFTQAILTDILKI